MKCMSIVHTMGCPYRGITGGVTLGPVASRCIIPNELQLVWNDASGRHRSLMHWRQLIIGFPMHQRLVANRCIIPIELQLDWNNASVRHQPECHPSCHIALVLRHKRRPTVGSVLMSDEPITSHNITEWRCE